MRASRLRQSGSASFPCPGDGPPPASRMEMNRRELQVKFSSYSPRSSAFADRDLRGIRGACGQDEAQVVGAVDAVKACPLLAAQAVEERVERRRVRAGG